METPLVLLPLAALSVGAVAAFYAGRLFRPRGGLAAGIVALAALAAAFGSFLLLFDPTGATAAYQPFGEAVLRADGLAVLLGLVATGLGFAVTAWSVAAGRLEKIRPLYTSLFLLLVAGVAGLGLAGDLFNLYVFFELMAIASYALVAYHRDRADASEAGMKYLIMNGAGSVVALLGIAVVYLSTPGGSLDFEALRAGAMPRDPALLATALLIGGFGVKAAIVPLHTWLPDAYTAAPTGVSAILAGVVTQSGLIALVRSLSVVGVDPSASLSAGTLLAFFAVLTMTVGNLTALHQTDIKRLLAYSSVAQVGYVLLGFGVGLEFGAAIALTGALFHFANHALMKGGAFLAAGALERAYGTRDLAALAGAGRRLPWVGASLLVFILGLAGVPPTAGFLSKLFIAAGAVEAGGVLGSFLVVAFIGNSVLSLAYYVPLLSRLLTRGAGQATPARVPAGLVAPVVALAVLVVVFGLWPDLVLRFVGPAVRSLLAPGGP